MANQNIVSMKALLEAGVHFGHQTRRWNPKMAPYSACLPGDSGGQSGRGPYFLSARETA